VTQDLVSLRVTEFSDKLASDEPAPGGGSAAALAGALAAALVEMVARLTAGREKFADAQTEMTAVLNAAPPIREELTDLVDRDTRAFQSVMAAFRLSKGTPEEKKARRQAIEEATEDAVQVPLRVSELTCEVLALARVVAAKGNPNAITDAGVAGRLALAAAEGAGLNVKINLPGIKDDTYREETAKRVDEYLNLAREAAAEVAREVDRRMA